MHVREMISTHPDAHGRMSDTLLRCIEECYDCAQTCTSCADACLGESMVRDLVQCIRLNLDCADLCMATGAMASRRSGANADVLRSAMTACAEACRACAEECRKHMDHHEHCRICAEACDACEEACRNALPQLH